MSFCGPPTAYGHGCGGGLSGEGLRVGVGYGGCGLRTGPHCLVVDGATMTTYQVGVLTLGAVLVVLAIWYYGK